MAQKFGIHLSISGGFASAAARAVELGCDVLQVFSRNPRSLRSKPMEPDDVSAFRETLSAHGVSPCVIHVNYLINAASPKPDIYELSVAALAEELSRADALGAEYVVMHPGHHLGSGIDPGIQRVARAIDLAFEQTNAQTTLCLENMAGVGTEIGASFADLRRIIDAARVGDGLGFCLDTCHAYGAGYDVSTDRGLDRTIGEIDQTIGLARLKVVHANDSKGKLGSGKDRHEHIGLGFIGLAGFRVLLARVELASLPFILETPVDDPRDQERDLASLRSCRRGESAAQAVGAR
ncbi:MAG: deoxyribonuclease IV [Firmicutes bacterium]|jgi:deoxyribonuclease-4|nr:deoxyribonuclease IV [Bacillota bacterium]